ncbi:methyl-accepting chemotaxis protein [Rhizobium leguminosarum]|uniref:methyl-accepting chemotaxis protein n=1 Tax=Rhizobium leguminosarum TaxID=384 RepID=UPI001FD92331|nr:methyl-accepting chemotaxis protein [Rhizobium leguminosarum]
MSVKVRRPIWVKMTSYGFGAVLFASAAIGGQAWYRQSIANDEALQSRARSDLSLIQTDMGATQRAAAALALALASDPDTAKLILGKEREAILSKYGSGLPAISKEGGLQFVTFVDVKGSAVARLHAPDKFGDDMTGRRKMVVKALSTGKVAAGVEPGRASIGMYASAPVIQDGRVVGVVDVGTELSNPYFGPIADRIGGEIAVNVVVDGKLQLQASTLDGKSMLTAEQIQSAFAGKPVFDEISSGGRDILVQAVPFTNFSGDPLGVLEIGADSTEILAASSSALWATVVGSVVVSLLSLVGFLLFARNFSKIIGNLTGTMSRLAENDLDVTIEGKDRPDEIGAMASAFEVFKENAEKARNLEVEATANRQQTEEQRQKTAELDRKRTAEMALATQSLAEGLRHLSLGDLTYQIVNPLPADFEALRSDFNQAVGQLRETLSAVARSTTAIDSGSREISASADDLSKRTEQQAASLEETAAALDQITTNVANSTKRADEARSVAIQANENARQSGVVVASAVDAMGKIKQSSGQISNIIGVIDDIAFQTNLLALNAGVEAARAGEAGKGFAVVAQEVRELAQRSAKAAKEIKELIRNSSAEVENGVTLVSQTGDALKAIEAFIVTINQHMDSIATSAREQSIGLSEVNTAVNQMDQVTQQNAAMVEEANAASGTLANEAGNLRSLVARFKAETFSAAAGPVYPRETKPQQSPVRTMMKRVASSFGSNAVKDDWQEF